MKKTTLALLLLFASLPIAAAEYFVVVPVQGRASSQAEIGVALNTYTMPDGVVGVPYSAFDFKQLLQVTGDASSDLASATFSASALPQGLALSEAGILTGTPTEVNEAGAGFQVSATYKSKSGQESYSMIVHGAAASCLALKQLQPDAADGVYTLVPDGVSAVQTYCDMTNGGWTLVARRTINKTTGTATSSYTDANPATPSFLPDAAWVALKANSTLLRVVPNGGPLTTASIIQLAKVRSANCSPLASSLSQGKLFHNESSGCSISGLDYTMLGVSATRPTYVSNKGSVTWDVSLDTNTEYSSLTVWVQ